MIRIEIGTAERDLGNATPSWINQQINRRRADGQTVCVRVHVDCPGINLRLSTPTCGGGTPGGPPPTGEEKRIIDLWKDRGLTERNFKGGDLVSFLRQLESQVGVC